MTTDNTVKCRSCGVQIDESDYCSECNTCIAECCECEWFWSMEDDYDWELEEEDDEDDYLL